MAKNFVRPFVKPGEPLGFVAPLKERGLWPPRLHDRKDHNDDQRKTTTPFLVIPITTTPADSGERPQPNSKAFHSKGIWIEDPGGAVVAAPVVGGQYRVKCRVRNLGAFPAYGGMADFFVNKPATFTAAAGSAATLPSIGHTGFSLLVSQETVISCPNLWKPATADDLASSIVVHAYDPFADNLISRFDARNDRHVGRHDFTPDLYVRDWTDSAAIHDDGIEPSARNVFYHTSDVWNRRSAAPGAFVDDQPQNQNPQQGNGPAGDNFMFARISRNDASVAQTVRAHFLLAEFGTGSPFVDCSAAPDPSVTLAPGDSSQIVSLPWHLHPTSSNHLCIAVQVYSDEDPYMPPGLLGYTPGWPTTDMMVINDNNKAQRNIGVWDGIPDTEGTYFGIVFNAAMYKRDVTLTLDASKGAMDKLRNARISVPASGLTQEFRPGSSLVLTQMLPGERRWVAFSYDSVSFTGQEDVLSVYFGEQVERNVVNGFGFDLRPSTVESMVQSIISFQGSVFYRMSEGLGVDEAREGFALCKRLQEANANLKAYFEALPMLTQLLAESLKRMSAKYDGVKDVFGLQANIRELDGATERQGIAALALHNKVLHQTDAIQTMATKSKGDVADILFTVRLQKEVYTTGTLASSMSFAELLKRTDEFIHAYETRDGMAGNYVPLVQALMPSFKTTVTMIGSHRLGCLGYAAMMPFFKTTVTMIGGGPVRARYANLTQSLTRTPEEVQKAHLNFLNAVLQSIPSQ